MKRVARSSGTSEDFSSFFEIHYTRVARTVFLLVHDREVAEDIAQEAFMKLLANWARVSRYELPEGWVRRIAIRLGMKHLRRQRLHLRTLERLEPPSGTPEPPDPDLMRAVRALPPAQRSAVVLFYFVDLPVREIAEIIDCSEATAKVHLHKARRRLGTLLEEAVDVS